VFRASFILRGASLARGRELPELAIGHLLEALAAWNTDLLRHEAEQGRPLPSMYELGRAGRMRYERERSHSVARGGHIVTEGREEWLDAPEIIARGKGDCEDLACWRVGELRAQGVPARVTFSIRSRPHGRLFHIIVERGDGQLEDPSRALGMRP
jgi:hypothetical protein